MLKQNTTIFAQYPLRRFGGAFCQERSMFGRTDKRNWFASENSGRDQKSGFPDGTLPPGTALMAQKSGGIASRNSISGSSTFSLSMAGGVNGVATIAGAGDIIPPLGQLVVSAVANLTGSGVISDAAGQAFLNAVASLSGSGSLTNVALGALGWVQSGVSGSGSVSSGTIRATGTLAAALTLQGGTLTTDNVGAAVWQYLIESGYSGEQIMRLLAAHAAGDATSLEGSSPAFRSIDGTKTRIGGTYAAGTRTVTTRDGS